jgi:polyhydroxyalkanoate synthesis regulator phasin
MSSMKELLYQRETAAFMIAEREEEIKQLRSEIERLRQQIRDVRASIV